MRETPESAPNEKHILEIFFSFFARANDKLKDMQWNT